MSLILLLFFWRQVICPFAQRAGPLKHFVKGMDKTDRGFENVRNKLPSVSDAKIKEAVLMGPQIRELMQGKQFDEYLN
jgi:hypothetical protein